MLSTKANPTNLEPDPTDWVCPVCGLSEAAGLLHVQEDIALQRIARAASNLVSAWKSKKLERQPSELVFELMAALDAFYAIPVEAQAAINSLLQMERELSTE